MGSRWSSWRRVAAAISVTVVPALTVVACGGGDSVEKPARSDYLKSVGAPSLTPGDPIPAPTGDVVLTVDGEISNGNKGDEAVFDMDTLRTLGMYEYTAVDHAGGSDAEVRFSGVLLSDLLAVVGAADTATELHTVALNDYAVDIPIDDTKKMPVMLAVEADGEEMSVEEFGPIRVVYPNQQFELDFQENEANWIWQLASITVR